MKKKLLGLLLMGGMMIGLTSPAFAQTYYGGSDWTVNFNQNKVVECNFKTADINDAVVGMQPGDNVIFRVALKNSNSETTDWYMENKVLASLEDKAKAADGGAYIYQLTYTDKAGKVTTLFDSDTVGGEGVSKAGEGLHQATDALEEYFFLDTLAKGDSGSITLAIELDGETQGNGYQNTLADLQMNFAVELPDAAGKSATPTSKTKSIYTGDDTNPIPYIVAAAIAGIFLLVLAIVKRKKDNKQH
ncbi:MAG: hypothetical protein Q4P20_06490 [Eubacteriales bacterium]|nr:hypothetical protein [Eubacteriales bacterium]